MDKENQPPYAEFQGDPVLNSHVRNFGEQLKYPPPPNAGISGRSEKLYKTSLWSLSTVYNTLYGEIEPYEKKMRFTNMEKLENTCEK